MKPSSLVLASQSPRRREYLSSLGISFEVDVSAVEEIPKGQESAKDYTLRLAREKCLAVASRHPGKAVLAADTVVVLRGPGGEVILEKPFDDQDALRMLMQLQGRSHFVITAYYLHSPPNEPLFEAVESEVEFIAYTRAEAQAYVETGEPMDKAGAYAIQGGASKFVKQIRGSYTSIVGLPLSQVYEALRKCNLVR